MRSKYFEECVHKVRDAVSRGELLEAFRGFEEELCDGAIKGLDLGQFADCDDWITWLKWASISLDENDYLKAALYGLSLAQKLAATDYGTSRQRDLGQLWTDTIRGFLGEIAFMKWLRERFGVIVELDYERGPIAEFLPSDIRSVNGREPRLRVSIKTTKLGGIWLDIPGAQIKHSDVFVLVRAGITREHFIAFLKKISVIGEKFVKEALNRGLLREEELREIWNAVPEFESIPACIAGFLDKSEYADELKNEYSVIDVDGKVGRKRVVINKYLGFWHPEKLEYKVVVRDLLKKKGKNVTSDMEIEFEGIGNFSRTLHFIASSGILKKKKEHWERLLYKL